MDLIKLVEAQLRAAALEDNPASATDNCPGRDASKKQQGASAKWKDEEPEELDLVKLVEARLRGGENENNPIRTADDHPGDDAFEKYQGNWMEPTPDVPPAISVTEDTNIQPQIQLQTLLLGSMALPTLARAQAPVSQPGAFARAPLLGFADSGGIDVAATTTRQPDPEEIVLEAVADPLIKATLVVEDSQHERMTCIHCSRQSQQVKLKTCFRVDAPFVSLDYLS